VKRRNARYKSGCEEIEQKQLAMLSAQTRHSSGRGSGRNLLTAGINEAIAK
jgi:hypothetical protein